MADAQEFWPLPDRIAVHARQCPARRAIVHGARTLTYFELDALLARFAAGLARDGIEQRSAVAIVSATTLEMALAFGARHRGRAG
jgi:non-ribosomal peptide synthetase component E (peptide arylation enzyme)